MTKFKTHLEQISQTNNCQTQNSVKKIIFMNDDNSVRKQSSSEPHQNVSNSLYLQSSSDEIMATNELKK